MENAKFNVIRFDKGDVIATSGDQLCTINHITGNGVYRVTSVYAEDIFCDRLLDDGDPTYNDIAAQDGWYYVWKQEKIPLSDFGETPVIGKFYYYEGHFLQSCNGIHNVTPQ